jgi:hypothetical protein
MDENSKKILTKRFQTTMIGAFLWGHDKDENELTEEELDLLDRWDFCRNQILNNGNNQLRKGIADLDKYNGDIKYNYRFTQRKED